MWNTIINFVENIHNFFGFLIEKWRPKGLIDVTGQNFNFKFMLIKQSNSFDLYDLANLSTITINISKIYEKLTESFQISPKYILIKKFSAAKITIF